MKRLLPALIFAAAASLQSAALPFSLEGKRVEVPLDGAPATAVVLVSTICPVSNAYLERLAEFYRAWSVRGVRFVFVNPNANETPADVAAHARVNELPFPVHTDPDETAVRVLKAAMTPKVFVFDNRGELRYRGRIDDAQNPARVKSHTLKETLAALVAGTLAPGLHETRALGCTIKRRR